ncbi:undecaprenyldiphospho-muramoylpentapeptide beta-N-acetylglucosaminyltransferase [Pseudoclostridium thermosuccinogenes]|uniref:undecaprenyldiphospho-muramoylpentapeptide beta-N-acetylglucosaminyltransferase n=1 Tax=Clostridium thermosuccinogenes TaxID=84032 RepID=UPI002FD9ECE1
MKVLMAGGGTAGHINPGLAIANYLKQKHPDAQIKFVGTERGLETRLVTREGYELELIKVRGFKRKLSFDTIIAIKELFQGMVEARKIIKRYKPDIVIGTGGYVCGPVLFNAAMMKIPTLIHEQNAYPGVTNKILSRYADAVAISFKESEKYFKSAKKIALTGNPVRDEILHTDKVSARKRLGISSNSRVVVVVGGSRGAQNINNSVVDMLKKYYNSNDFNIIFATGEAQYDRTMESLGKDIAPTVEVVPYIYNAADVYAAADLMVCRAGAITLSELTAMGIPAILIPSPFVTANHQEYNARSLEKNGAAVVILEKELSGNVLYNQIMSLLKNREQLSRMASNSKKMGITNATEKIYSMIREVMKQKGKH